MKNRGVFRTLSNIYDEAFLQKQVMVKRRYLIFKKKHHRCLYLDMFSLIESDSRVARKKARQIF